MMLIAQLETARCAFHDAARIDLGVRPHPQTITDSMWSWYPESEIRPE